MTGFDVWLCVVAGGLILLAGVLACAEAAISRVSRVRAQELVREGRRSAPSVLAIATDPARYVNVLLFLRSSAEVAAVVLVAIAADDVFAQTWIAVVVAVGVMVVVTYIAVGVAPRTVGRQHAARVALLTAPAVRGLATVLAPLTRLLILVGNALTPGKGYRSGPFATEAELRELVDLAEADAVIEDDERQMIHSVFELGDKVVREVMVPRTDMLYIERGKTLRQTLSLALRSGFSRIPVVGEGLDDVVGIAYLKDVARRTNARGDVAAAEPVETAMRPVYFVPDSKPLDELLRDMQAARVHVAVVVDEYGGTAGLVTIEDVLEEIVGEITDEYDVVETPPVETLDEGRFRVSARLPLDDLAELVNLDLEHDHDDVDTVGGLLAKLLGKVPITGSIAELPGWTLTAESSAGRRNQVRTVLVEPAVAVDDKSSSGVAAGADSDADDKVEHADA
jgi:CBS domain containing-hemolysin-like protein